MPALPIIVALAGSLPLALMWLTALGARKRGMRLPTACLVGIPFPLTWAAWYVRDELPGASRGWSRDRR
jgi:hypothetical protein